ncbi:AAA family ATPase [Salinibacter ruber]|uniref:nucleotide-binding protein n=1 Tax=Salinibacter ruber TaxID=146919 RepID=UPI000E57ABF9|nr:AAA family ATPase [Salinibacter ruber]
MPLTLACVNPKGGSGKTTIAVHLGVVAHRSGYSAKIVDADPQGSVVDWSRRTPEGYDGPPVEHVRTEDSLTPHVEGAEVVVVDSPARLDERTGAVLSVADLALVPVRPSGLDLWGTAEFLDVLADHTGAGLQAAFIASQRDVRTSLSEELEEVLAGRGLPLLDGFTFRVAYARSLSEGRTVLDGSDDTAREEVHQLLRDVGELLS